MPAKSQSCGSQTLRSKLSQPESFLSGDQKQNQDDDQPNMQAGLIDRLWPLRIKRLRAHNIPATDHLRMPVTIWFSSVIINLLGVALPVFILQVYDRIIPNQTVSTLVMMVLGFIGILSLEFLLRVGRAYVMGWAATRFEIEASQQALQRLLDLPLEHITAEKTQTHMDRLTSIFRLADFFCSANSLLVIDLPFVLILVVIMGLIAGPLVFVPIGILLVFAVLTLQFGRRLRERFEEREKQDNKTYDFIAECLRGVITLKGLSMEPFMLRRFERLQKARAQTNYGTIYASSSAQSISSILGNVTIISTVSVGATYAVMANMSIGTLAACTLLAGRIIQPVVRFAGLWSEFQKLELALFEAGDLFRKKINKRDGVIDKNEGTPLIRVDNLVLFQDGSPLNQPFSMTIGTSDCIGVSGKDNWAKTQFLEKLAGLHELEAGRILYNDVDVMNYRSGNPGYIVMVGQKSSVFDGSILDNISLFGTGPTVEEIEWAAGMTGIDVEVNSLPFGYDTPIGDGAREKLPHGLIQRILLTRAIAMLPKVLVLDEPQMFLDQASDRKLITCLGALRHHITIVISTMRPSYFQLVDRLVKFDDGEITIETDLVGRAKLKPKMPERQTSA